jgi:hypothetical protein
VTSTWSPSTVHPAGESALRAVHQRGEHLAGLVAVIVDRLLAQDHQPGLLLVGQRFEDPGHRQRLDRFIGLHQNGPVGAHGQRGAQRFARLGRADRDRDHLAGHALFLEAHGFLDGDLVEGVDAHLHIGQVHARSIGLTRGRAL